MAVVTELETARLVLRRFTADDAEPLHRIQGDPEVMRFVGNNQPISLDETRLRIAKTIEHYASRGCGCFAVLDRSSGRLIGYGGFVFRDPEPPELIYGFEKAAWGQGLGREVARAMVAHARERHRWPRIIATVDPANQASIRILRGLGMTWLADRLDEHGLPESLFELRL